jgi:HSP20 family protein
MGAPVSLATKTLPCLAQYLQSRQRSWYKNCPADEQLSRSSTHNSTTSCSGEQVMTTTSQQSQTVPLQVHQTDKRLVLAAPMPGLEAQDIAVIINGNRVTIQGEYRGSRQNQPEILISEWTIGPYYREVVLPQPVNGALTNATYGNGVLVLSMPTLQPGEQGGYTEFRLETDKGARGQRVGHTGSNLQPITPGQHDQQVDQTTE